MCLYPNLHRTFLTNQYCSLVVFVLQINSLKHRLNRLKEDVQRECADELASIPSSERINLEKFAGASLITDTCNGAQASRRIFADAVGVETHQQDCMNHLRCV